MSKKIFINVYQKPTACTICTGRVVDLKQHLMDSHPNIAKRIGADLEGTVPYNCTECGFYAIKGSHYHNPLNPQKSYLKPEHVLRDQIKNSGRVITEMSCTNPTCTPTCFYNHSRVPLEQVGKFGVLAIDSEHWCPRDRAWIQHVLNTGNYDNRLRCTDCKCRAGSHLGWRISLIKKLKAKPTVHHHATPNIHQESSMFNHRARPQPRPIEQPRVEQQLQPIEQQLAGLQLKPTEQ